MSDLVMKLAMTMAFNAIKMMMDKGLVLQVQQLVMAAFDFEGDGNAKKAKVWDELRDIGGLMGESVASTMPWLINALIELTVGKVQGIRPE